MQLALVSCTGLKELQCDGDAADLEELKRRRPNLNINLVPRDDEEEEVEEDI